MENNSSVTSNGEILNPIVEVTTGAEWLDPNLLYTGVNGMSFVDPILFFFLVWLIYEQKLINRLSPNNK